MLKYENESHEMAGENKNDFPTAAPEEKRSTFFCSAGKTGYSRNKKAEPIKRSPKCTPPPHHPFMSKRSTTSTISCHITLCQGALHRASGISRMIDGPAARIQVTAEKRALFVPLRQVLLKISTWNSVLIIVV